MEASKVVKFTKEKETKNTVKFIEVPASGQPPQIGTLYIQKWVAKDATTVTLTMELA